MDDEVIIEAAQGASGILSIVYVSIDGVLKGQVGKFNLQTKQLDKKETSVEASTGTLYTVEGKVHVVSNGKAGVLALIFDGLLVARIALYNNPTTYQQCLDLPLPIAAQPASEAGITNPNSIALYPADDTVKIGWTSVWDSANDPTRLIGFNLLPTASPAAVVQGTPEEIEGVQGGDYGIEFQVPSGATKVTIWDSGFWLYFIAD